MSFVHLHVHSAYSPYWGIHAPAALCAAARAMGMTCLALTDRNGLYGVPRFIKEAKKAGIAPLIGAEVVSGPHRAVLLARHRDGYANLCRLLSERHARTPFDLAQALQRYRSGLVVLSDDAVLLEQLAGHNRSDLFVELSPGHGMEQALATARRLELPPAATSRAVFLRKDDFELHRILRAIAGSTTLSRLSAQDCAAPVDLLWPAERLAACFPHCREALDNTARIADRCRTDWDFSATIFPRFRNLTDQQAGRELERRVRQGARWRYGNLDNCVEHRLAKELAIIRAKGFAHYFLVVRELSERSARTCGRGSAAASLVAYCLGITHVDPVRYNLFFERFLNSERIDPPDIDIDFPWDERDAVLDFALSRYGEARAAMVSNQVGFRGRAALREVAKVFGVPADEIKAVTQRLSDYGSARQAAQTMHEHPLFSNERFSRDWQHIIILAARLDGQLRHLAQHCGGLVVVPDDLRRYVPVEPSASGRPLIQWDKNQAEAAGLVKIDILGNRSLAVVRDALAAVHRNTGRTIDYRRWQPLHDRKTRALLCAGHTMGCFYIESPATRQLLKKLWYDQPLPDEDTLFEHLVMASSIIRPAANCFIREFIARMRGKRWHHLHPSLAPILDETYGLAVYQEQITQIAMTLSGFSAAEGDQLRKIISKKDKNRQLQDYRQHFFTGGRRNGIADAILQQAWEQILSFAGYSFCKPHSASYAQLSCKSAWLKANHPAEFMAAVLSNGGGYYSTLAYLSEARRMGLRILPPDINASDFSYHGSGRELRVGLMQIATLPRQAVDALLRERQQNGPFSGLGDFLQRLPQLTQADVRQLIKAGCFDVQEQRERRPTLIWTLLEHQRQPAANTNKSLFATPDVTPPELPPYTEAELLSQELETLGLPVSRHPLDRYRRAIVRNDAIPAAEMDRWAGRHVTLAGWWVASKPVRTADGQTMEFATFEDHSGIFDAIFLPAAYRRFCRKLDCHPCLLKGRVEKEFGVATLNVTWMVFLDGIEEKMETRDINENKKPI